MTSEFRLQSVKLTQDYIDQLEKALTKYQSINETLHQMMNNQGSEHAYQTYSKFIIPNIATIEAHNQEIARSKRKKVIWEDPAIETMEDDDFFGLMETAEHP